LIIIISYTIKRYNHMEESQYKKFIIFLEMFQNRPHHLARFLLENNILTVDFLKKLSDNTTLNQITDISKMKEEVYFKNIAEMKKYYKSIIYPIDDERGNMTKKEWSIEVNTRLYDAIEKENYEEACRLRDYMNRHNIKKL